MYSRQVTGQFEEKSVRYEDFSANLLRVGAGRGIPAVGAGLSSVVSVTLTPGSVAAAVVADQTGFTIPNIVPSDILIRVQDPITTSVALVKAQATAVNTVTLTFVNPTIGALTPATGTYTFLVFKTQ